MSTHKQQELFKAQTTWFHIFKAMIDNGDVAKMGPTATTVYLVIKAYSNMTAGYAFPSLETIAEGAGVSTRTVQRSIEVLEEFGYIEKKTKIGRSNIYKLREKIPVTAHGMTTPFAMASFDYIPTAINEATAELKNFLATGIDNGKLIHIERLVLNLQINNDGSKGTQFNLSDKALRELDKSTQEKIRVLLEENIKEKEINGLDEGERHE